MHKMISIIAITVALSGSALAQSEREPSSPKMPPPAGPTELTLPSADSSASDDEDDSKMQSRLEGSASAGHGARFHIEDRGTIIDMQCPDGEQMKDCADVLLQVLDRLQAGDSSSSDNDRDGRRDRERPRWRY